MFEVYEKSGKSNKNSLKVNSPASCRKKMHRVGDLLQVAGRKYIVPETRCKLQEKNASCRKLAASCRKKMHRAGNLLQVAGRKCIVPETRCKLQEENQPTENCAAPCKQKKSEVFASLFTL